jgi:hypothetical protein
VPVFGLVLALATPPALTAQSVTLRLGGFRTFYADTLDATAGSFGGEAAWSSARARLGLAGSVASFQDDGWAAQGTGNWTQVLTHIGRRGLLVTGDASGYGFNEGTWAGVAGAGLLGVLQLDGPASASLAASAGGVHRMDGSDDAMAQATVRVRSVAGAALLDAWASGSRAGAQRYGDVGAALRFEWSALTVDLSGGGRFGDLGDVMWAQARSAVRVVGPGWLEVSGGRYPPDVTGFTTGTFVQAGLRVDLGRPAPTPTPAGPTVIVERESDGVFLLTLRGNGRLPAAIAGDWNGWEPQPLQPLGGGLWRVRVMAAPGLHRFILLDPEGNAFVPDGVPTEPDEFGTLTGVLVVPRR